MRLLLTVPLLALSATCCAQGSNSASAPTNSDVVTRALATGKGTIASSTIGSSMLLPYWVRGTVQMTSGTVPRPWLKYDLNGGRLLWRRSPNDSLELDTGSITEFALRDTLHGQTYTYRRYAGARTKELSLRTAFFEVHYDAGRSALLQHHTRTLFHGNNGPSLSGRTPDRWVETSTFYIKLTDDKIEPVRLTSKSILAALGKNPALDAYAGREHLDLTQAADVVKLLRYYDTL